MEANRGTASEQGPALGRVLDFMRLLWALDHGLQSTSKRMEAVLGVTGPQRLVLRIVGQFPGTSAGEVANILHIHPSTLTGVLKRLQARGLIEREADPSDARRARLRLTTEGQVLNRTRAGTVEAAIRRVLGQLQPEKVQVVQEVLSLLTEEVSRQSDSAE
jgi:MarR family transcriptional regulator, organic hydroperoxide resistance regulator